MEREELEFLYETLREAKVRAGQGPRKVDSVISRISSVQNALKKQIEELDKELA